jgi:SPP1 gp7 family putative phage head morphogenesis protein
VKVWPAKRIKGRIAAKNAVKIKAALATTINPKTVASEYLGSNPFLTGNQTTDRIHARSWAMVHVQPKTEALKKAIERTIVEGWVTGEKAAGSMIRSSILKKNVIVQEMLDNKELNVWANWKPGDEVSAALLERKYGLDQLLIENGLTIRNISRTQIDEIGTQLADGLRQGLSIDEMASSIRDVVNNPAKALSIAMTEVSRATNQGAQNRYKEANITQNQWSGIDPCDKCAMNDGQIVKVGDPFTSGDTQPPAHPNCLCTLLPVIESGTYEDITRDVAQETDDAFNLARGREERLTSEIIGISRVVNASVQGLKTRLKQPKSIARKIAGGLKDGEYATAKEAADAMADLNRYTLSFESKGYVKGVKDTIEELTAKGYGLRVKNYWERADYKGINIAVKDATGKEFEVQLHTANSLAVKEDLHILYEQYRVNMVDEERWDLWRRMVEIAKKIETPADYEELKKIGVLKFEYFKDSKGNYRESLRGAIINPEKLKLPNKVIPEVKPVDVTYRGSHRASNIESGAPLHNITANEIYPPNTYTDQNLRLYGSGYPAMDKKIHDLLIRVQDNPDAEITIYRAIPKNATEATIVAGDWVTPIKDYAIQHGISNLNNDYKIISLKVKAREIYTSGDSLLEWGYNPIGGN